MKLSKHVENDGIIGCRSTKSCGFYAIFGRNAQGYDFYRRESFCILWCHDFLRIFIISLIFWEYLVLAPKHVENDGRSRVDRPKVAGFTPYLAGMLKAMIAI